VEKRGDLFAPLLGLPFADQQQRVGRQGRVVGDHALAMRMSAPSGAAGIG
jgi:hypothetical protein